MKTMQGAQSAASLNRSRTFFSDSPALHFKLFRRAPRLRIGSAHLLTKLSPKFVMDPPQSSKMQSRDEQCRSSMLLQKLAVKYTAIRTQPCSINTTHDSECEEGGIRQAGGEGGGGGHLTFQKRSLGQRCEGRALHIDWRWRWQERFCRSRAVHGEADLWEGSPQFWHTPVPHIR